MEFIDLGLPSNTLWASEDENGKHSYADSVGKYGIGIPSKKNWEELDMWCKCEPVSGGNAIRVTGPNGNSIVFPASGMRRTASGNECHTDKYLTVTATDISDAHIWSALIDYFSERIVPTFISSNATAWLYEPCSLRTIRH